MAAKHGAIVCPGCGSTISAREAACPFCGYKQPGMLGLGPGLKTLFNRVDMVTMIMVVCGIFFVLSLALEPSGISTQLSILDMLSPSNRAVALLGMTGGVIWQEGHWWTVLTANYLHGSLIHIGFNLWWINTLGRQAAQIFGPARFFIVYTVAGVAGFAASNIFGNLPMLNAGPPTLGASAAVFGLMGAMVSFGRRRGGDAGRGLQRHYLKWALIVFFIGAVMPGTNNWAHGGGFVGGLLIGGIVPVTRRRGGIHGESPRERLAAAALLGLTCVALIGNIIIMRQSLGWP